MCTLFGNLYLLLTSGPHTVYSGDPIYILYLCDQMWLIVYYFVMDTSNIIIL